MRSIRDYSKDIVRALIELDCYAKGYFFTQIMEKIKKGYNVKIISLFIAVSFFFNSTVYGIDTSTKSHLRVPVGESDTYERLTEAIKIWEEPGQKDLRDTYKERLMAILGEAEVVYRQFLINNNVPDAEGMARNFAEEALVSIIRRETEPNFRIPYLPENFPTLLQLIDSIVKESFSKQEVALNQYIRQTVGALLFFEIPTYLRNRWKQEGARQEFPLLGDGNVTIVEAMPQSDSQREAELSTANAIMGLKVFEGFEAFINLREAKDLFDRLKGVVDIRESERFRHVIPLLLAEKERLKNLDEPRKMLDPYYRYPSNCRPCSARVIRILKQFHFKAELRTIEFPKEIYPDLNIDRYSFVVTEIGGKEFIIDIAADQFEPLGENQWVDLGVVVLPVDVVNQYPEKFWMYTGRIAPANSSAELLKQIMPAAVIRTEI